MFRESIIDYIMTRFALLIIIIALSYLFIMLTVRIMPRWFLKPLFLPVRHERGIKKCTFESGRGVAYEPRLNLRKYVKQYVLFSENDQKYIKCKINDDISHIKYTLTVYNRADMATEVFTIDDIVEQEGYTGTVRLPEETSYISLDVDAVNGKTVQDSIPEHYSTASMLLYIALTTVFTVLLGQLYTVTTEKIIDLILLLSNGEIIEWGGFDMLFAGCVYLALGLVYALIMVVSVLPKKKIFVWSKSSMSKEK